MLEKALIKITGKNKRLAGSIPAPPTNDMKITIDIDEESMVDLIVSDLKDYHDNMVRELKNRPNVKYGVFFNDKKKDIAKLKEVIEALKIVINSYGS